MSSQPPERWRLFVAVPAPDVLRSSLADAVAGLRRLPGVDASWRWTTADGWHVTLAFLGWTAASRVPALTDALRSTLVGAAPFTVATGGLGAFPSPRAARVIWYGIHDPERRLRSLAEAIRDGLEAEPGPFRGHLTLARARDRNGADGAPLLSPPAPNGVLPVDDVVLYRSHLGRGPARYEALERVALAGAIPSVAAR